jgi:hypothetical protein
LEQAEIQKTIYLSKMILEIELKFNTTDLFKKGNGGPYELNKLEIYFNNNLKYQLEQKYETMPYS